MVHDREFMRFRCGGHICITFVLLFWLLPATALSDVFTDDFNRADGPLGEPWFLVSGSPLSIAGNRVVGDVEFGTMGYRPGSAWTDCSLEYDLCFNGDNPGGGPFHLILSGEVGPSAWGFIGEVSLEAVTIGRFFPEQDLATAYYPFDAGATYHARLEYLHDINRLSLVLENDQGTPVVSVDAVVSPPGPFELGAIAIEKRGTAIKWLDNVSYLTDGLSQTWRITVVADSTLAGREGYILLREAPGDSDHLANYFMVLDSGQVRFFASREAGAPDWTIFPEGYYFGPPPGAVIGDSWTAVPGNYGRPSRATLHAYETVDVPAGTFTAAVCVVHPETMGAEGPATNNVMHFAEGVGLVREFWPWIYGAHVLQSYSVVGGSGQFPLAVGNWWEYLEQWGVFYPTAVDAEAPLSAHLLLGNAPNPFNPATEIAFAMASTAHARMSVHDAAGRHVRTLVDESREAGRHKVTWDGRDANGRTVASGAYLVRFVVGASVQTRSVKLLK
jgi:hypothetical protein